VQNIPVSEEFARPAVGQERDNTRTRSLSRQQMNRKPSCLIS
jgi:hypothetical protein